MFRHTRIEAIIAGVIIAAAIIFQTFWDSRKQTLEGMSTSENEVEIVGEYDFIDYSFIDSTNKMILEVEKDGNKEMLIHSPDSVKLAFSETRNPYVQVLRNKSNSSITVSILLPYGYKLGDN